MQLEHLSKSSIYIDPFQSPTRNQTEIYLYNISTPTHVIKIKRKNIPNFQVKIFQKMCGRQCREVILRIGKQRKKLNVLTVH